MERKIVATTVKTAQPLKRAVRSYTTEHEGTAFRHLLDSGCRIDQDPVFTRIIDMDACTVRVKRFIPSSRFAGFVRRYLHTMDTAKQPVLKRSFQEKEEPHINYELIASLHPEIFEDIDAASRFFQFSFDLKEEDMGSLSPRVRGRIHSLFNMTGLDETIYYTVRKANHRGDIKSPLDKNHNITVSSEYAHRWVRVDFCQGVLRFYGMEGEYITEVPYNPAEQRFKRPDNLESKKKCADWFLEGETGDSGNKLPAGVIDVEHPGEARVSIGKKSVSIYKQGTYSLEFKLPKDYPGNGKIEGICTPVLVNIPDKEDFRLVKGLRISYVYQGKNYSFVTYKGQSDRRRKLFTQPEICLTVPAGTREYLVQSIKRRFLVDTDTGLKVTVVLNQDKSIRDIRYVSLCNNPVNLTTKSICSPKDGTEGDILITAKQNYSYRVAPLIDGVLQLSPLTDEDKVRFTFEKESPGQEATGSYACHEITVSHSRMSNLFVQTVLRNPRIDRSKIAFYGVVKRGHVLAIIPAYENILYKPVSFYGVKRKTDGALLGSDSHARLARYASMLDDPASEWLRLERMQFCKDGYSSVIVAGQELRYKIERLQRLVNMPGDTDGVAAEETLHAEAQR